VLHPRWIAIRRDQSFADPLLDVQKIVQEALGEDSDSTQHPPDFKSIIGDEMFTSIDERQEALIKSWLSFLRKSKSSEAQWESRLWRRWFLKDTSHTPPNCAPSNSKPFIGQAQMSLSSDGSVIPPLLATGRRVVTLVPWNPNLKEQKGGHVLWYPDYLYAVSKSSLELRIQFRNVPLFGLPRRGIYPPTGLRRLKTKIQTSNISLQRTILLL
jgi:hypothetical protein